MTTKEAIESKYNVEIRNFSEVITVNPKSNSITVKNLTTNEVYEESYDKLLLSTGSSPFVPPMEGKDFNNVFTLWNIPDTDKIYNYINDNNVKNAVVVGGGFIGVEMAENLVERGINLILGGKVDKIIDKGKKVVLADGTVIDTELTLLSIGIRANTNFLKDSGIDLNQRGGVIADEYMQTNIENIYAIGDMIETTNLINNQKTMIPLAGIANKQGRAVAANILGQTPETFDGAIGTSILKVFDLTVAATGENEKSLNQRGLKRWIDYGISLVHPNSHAGYYPNALPMTIKLIFDLKTAKVLGAQIIGFDGVDKRIDTIATSLYFKATIYDLTKIELAYAPPYSSAKDPVNMAAYAATNIYEQKTTPITLEELKQNLSQYKVIDVREPIEISTHEFDSVNIPLSQIRNRLNELNKEQEYIIFCAVGLRGYLTERILKQNGFKARNLLGGYRTISEFKVKETAQPTEKKQVQPTSILDVCGLSCPGPIIQVSKKLEDAQPGEVFEIKATDPGFIRDIESWCNNTGNHLIQKRSEKGTYYATIEKGSLCNTFVKQSNSKEKTMIVFDGDLDKAIAAFIIANGSVAMGNKVNMFFTFWGLNILRKKESPKVKKDFISKMFGFMMPKGAGKLSLSKMNFMGLGSKMMRMVMKKKGVTSLEDLIQEAINSGVKIVACQMSMDVMGITKEELIDGVEIGGVATMLDDNDRSNMNLFI